MQIGLARDSEFKLLSSSPTSIDYFLKKALTKSGLELSGMRLLYLDAEQADLYEHLFNEKIMHS